MFKLDKFHIVVLSSLIMALSGYAIEQSIWQLNFSSGIEIRTILPLYEKLTERAVLVSKGVNTRLPITLVTGKVTKSEAIAAIDSALWKQLRLEIVKVDELTSRIQQRTESSPPRD